MELSPQYQPQLTETKWYDYWLKLGVFTASAERRPPKYCIMMPPPNVTGFLHMGHALSYTLEDILVRWRRMQGYNTLWLPGTDHAGIATQMVVERNLLNEEKKSRHELGRDEFLKRVWEWKRESEGTILSQLKKLGTSPDWSRLRFTLDETLSSAVREAFVRLFKEGLIYRDEAMTSWCPRCRTALSDLEVKFKPIKGHLSYVKYLRKDNPSQWLTVATTRPETILGDTAVAVHPEDDRYHNFHGKSVVVPLINREVPVVCDAYVDKEFGTGALKITPAHDPNDYAIGRRLGLQSICIFDETAHLNSEAGPYRGLSRELGRTKVLEDLNQQGLLEKETDYTHNVGHCDRCGVAVEPRISQQWFVKADLLAGPAIEAVETKKIKIIPEEWEKTYFEWMRNIRPWCISRQLWWGHRIPVWYCRNCRAEICETVDPKSCPQCNNLEIVQDDDVLDTWFSSGLWPFSTLGWPKQTPDLKCFYPTDVMETGFDILFFWVARMIMLGIKMTGQIPFHTVYLHPMVRDEYGQKMSKTKGNVKDPLEIIESKGADALRFTLTAMAVHGRDVLLSDTRIEGYRNFVNKIWNAARFVLLHFGEVTSPNVDSHNPINQWIWSRFNTTVQTVETALEQYRFFDVADRLYQFIWKEYCDWFIEFIKSDDELRVRKAQKESTAIQILEGSLKLLHPVMPFVTEEIWQSLPLRDKEKSIGLSSFPKPNPQLHNPDIETRFSRVIACVESIRSKRGESGLSPAKEIGVSLFCSPNIQKDLSPFQELIRRLARSKGVIFLKSKPDPSHYLILPHTDFEVYLSKHEVVITQQNSQSIRTELESVHAELERAKAKLNNPDFVSKAPAQVVKGVLSKKEELEKKITSLTDYLESKG